MRPVYALLAALAVLGCADSQAPEEMESLDASVTGGLTLSDPDLAGIGEPARRRIAAARAAAERALAATSETSEKTAAAASVGDLCALYLAYDYADAATECLDLALSLSPDEFRWNYYLGLAAAVVGDLAVSAAAFERAALLDPADLAAQLRSGAAALEVDDTDAAEGAYRAASEISPEAAAAWHGLGRVAERRGDSADAIAHYERALKLQPHADQLHYSLGQLYRRLADDGSGSNRQKAVQHLAAAGERRVGYPEPLVVDLTRIKVATMLEVMSGMARQTDSVSTEDLVGFGVSQLGEIPGATQELERFLVGANGVANAASAASTAVDLEGPPRARMFLVLGVLQARQAMHEQAITSFDGALALQSALELAVVRRAASLASLGRTPEALAALDELLASDPDNQRALLGRAATLMGGGEAERARRDLERLLRLAPGNAEARLRLGEIYAQAGRTADAASQYEAALGLVMEPPDRALTHFRLAEIERRRDARQEAEENYDAALRLDPGFSAARLGRAGLLAQTGRLDEARVEYRRVREEDPRQPAAWQGEAATLILAGRHAEARDRLEEGLERNPANRGLQATLARHLAGCPDRSVRDGARALELARLATGDDLPGARILETVAMALAELGRFEEAEEVQRRLAEAASDSRERGRLAANLELYRAGKPCCAGMNAG